jgi:flagellar assembly factor FliW
MVIQSTRLGQLEVPTEEIVKFPGGLPGFPHETAFALIPHSPDSPFAFLQSVAEPNLTFLIVDPFPFFNDYQFDVNDGLLQEIGAGGDIPIRVFNIVTVPEKVAEMTANLLAPIVVNWNSRNALQVVLEKTAYTTRHRLFPQGFPQKSDKGEK